MLSYANAPTVADCVANQYTIRDVAENILGLKTYDAALPQEWVRECQEQGYDPRGSFVWVYRDEGDLLGSPFPLTREAALEIPAHLMW